MTSDAKSVEDLQGLAREGIMGATVLLTTNIASTGLAAINSILIARALGPHGYGQYTLALTSTQIMLLATGLGLPSAITYYASKQTATRDMAAAVKTLEKTMLITIVNAAAAMLLGAFLVPLIMRSLLEAEEATRAALIALPTVLMIPIINVYTSFFIGVGKTEYSGATNTAREALRLAVLAILTATAALTLNRATSIYTATYTVATCIAISLATRITRNAGDKQTREKPPSARELLAYGFPFYVAGILAGLLGIYQNTLMARKASEAELAGLRASMNIITALSILSSPIYSMALPIFSKTASKTTIQKIHRLAQGLSAALLTPITLYFIVESQALLRFFYGEKYIVYQDYLAILSLTNLTVLLGSGLIGGALAGTGKPWRANSITIAELASFLATSALLSKTMGPIGIVASVTISRWIASIYAYLLARKTIGISIDPVINAKVVAASLASIAIVAAIHKAVPQSAPAVLTLAVTMATLLATYIPIVSALKPFRDIEVDFLLLSIEGKGPVYAIAKTLASIYKKIPRIKR